MTTFTEAYRATRPVTSNGHGARPKRTPVLVHAGRLAGRAAGRLPRWDVVRTAVLQVVAVVCAVAGALILWGPGIAFFAASAGLFVLEALTGDGP